MTAYGQAEERTEEWWAKQFGDKCQELGRLEQRMKEATLGLEIDLSNLRSEFNTETDITESALKNLEKRLAFAIEERDKAVSERDKATADRTQDFDSQTMSPEDSEAAVNSAREDARGARGEFELERDTLLRIRTELQDTREVLDAAREETLRAREELREERAVRVDLEKRLIAANDERGEAVDECDRHYEAREKAETMLRSIVDALDDPRGCFCDRIASLRDLARQLAEHETWLRSLMTTPITDTTGAEDGQ